MTKKFKEFNLRVFKKEDDIDGFTVKAGFVGLFKADEMLVVTSGWEDNNYLYVYEVDNEGVWHRNSYAYDDAEVGEIIIEMKWLADTYQRQQEILKAIEIANKEDVFVSDVELGFDTVIAGKKCNNGGEYGFWVTYKPIDGLLGVYEVYSHTTCDFDACNTGYEGIFALTLKEYEALKAESDRVIAEGCKY